MSNDSFYPMALADDVPGVIRYHQHLPPPSNPTEFMVVLRHGLRGVNKVGLWGKLKGVGRRFLHKFDHHTHLEIPPCPNSPVAPPGTPDESIWLPDVCITPASPSCEFSPPLPQVAGFLSVPTRTSRGRSVDISPRPLPTPPDIPPSYSVPEVDPCQCTKDTPYPSTSEPLASPDLSTCDIVAALLYADSVVTPDNESLHHNGPVRLQQQSPVSDSTSDTASSDSPSEPRDSPLILLSNTMVEAIRDTAADTEFLDELGMSANEYIQLLEGVDFVQVVVKEEGLD